MLRKCLSKSKIADTSFPMTPFFDQLAAASFKFICKREKGRERDKESGQRRERKSKRECNKDQKRERYKG
jgi:hypothetical protein